MCRAKRGGTSRWRSAATAATRPLPATTSATCRTRSRRRSRDAMPERSSPAAAWLGRALAAVAASAEAAARRHAAREPRPRSGRRLLRRPGVSQTGGRATVDGAVRRIATARAARSTNAVTEPYRRCPSRNAVQRAEYADLKIYMPNDPLVKVDRMSMAHSLEVRCPLLDRRVVELAFRIPAATEAARDAGQGAAARAGAPPAARRAVAASEARIHGADRRMDRRAARRQFDDEVFDSSASISRVLDRVTNCAAIWHCSRPEHRDIAMRCGPLGYWNDGCAPQRRIQ